MQKKVKVQKHAYPGIHILAKYNLLSAYLEKHATVNVVISVSTLVVVPVHSLTRYLSVKPFQFFPYCKLIFRPIQTVIEHDKIIRLFHRFPRFFIKINKRIFKTKTTQSIMSSPSLFITSSTFYQSADSISPEIPRLSLK